MRNWIFLWIILALLPMHLAQAEEVEVIEFPEEELETETVLPIFDRLEVIKERRVVTKGRFELGAAIGMNMTEALYNQMNYQFMGSYHFDETHGVNLLGIVLSEGLSNDGQKLKSVSPFFDASFAPSPKSFFFGNYQFTAWYGKISITKQFVMNLSLYGLAGLGMVSFGDSTSVGGSLGFGQKFYFSPSFGLRLDVRFFGYQGPDPTTHPLNTGVNVSSSDLGKRLYTPIFLSLGFVFLL